MAKKSSEKPQSDHGERNRRRKLKTATMKDWSERLRELAKQMEAHADHLEKAKVFEIEVIFSGFYSALEQCEHLMISQFDRRVRTTIRKAGSKAAAEEE